MRKLVGLLAVIVVSLQASGQKPALITGSEAGWYKIGETTASFEKERESIIVLGKDDFSALRLRVLKAPIEIDRIQIFFESGKMQEEEIKQPLKEGEETREIKLNAENTEIDRVVFLYRTAANDKGDKASVQLYGRKDGEETATGSSAGDDSVSRDTLPGTRLRDEAAEVEDAREQRSVGEHEGRRVEGKTGPEGQAVYLDDDSQYFWVDEDGKRHYVDQGDLRDKT